MKALYDIPAPAKLNLFLHITHQREDGYHVLQSVFMLIDWLDILHFEKRSNGKITREDLTMVLPEDDLIVRAARLLQQRHNVSEGVHIAVEKNIPNQAGMGGGSSDAASVLIALNRLWNLNLKRQELASLALQLGADVPFFVMGENAWVEGIGDQITPLEGEARLPKAQFVVIKPEAGLETGKIFSSKNLKRDKNAATIADFAGNHYDFGENQLQKVAESLCSELTQALDYLTLKGFKPRMTGSGSAVFALIQNQLETQSHFQSQVELEIELKMRLKMQIFSDISNNWKMRICSNLDIHPLFNFGS